MLTYDLKVGYGCNNRCKHCVIDDSKNKLIEQHTNINLTTDECMKQIDDALKMGITGIVLTGGEVTIRRDFPDLIKKCSDNNLDITIQTNGRKLDNDYIVNVVKDIKNIRFIVALHGETAEVHDGITQVPGSFAETCRGIRRMCDLNKLVVLKVVISKINARELPGIVDVAAALGVKYFCFAFPHGQGAARKNFKEIIPKYLELKPILNKLISVAKDKNVYVEFEAIPFCIIPNNMNLVGELKYFDGNTICTQVKEDTFNWSDVRKSIKRKGPACSKCDMTKFCEGPWVEYVEAFGFDEFSPIAFPTELKERFMRNIELYLQHESSHSVVRGI